MSAGRNSTEPGKKILGLVGQMVKEVHPASYANLDITLDSSFDGDLGLDSLTRVELISRVERTFQVSLPERVLATAETPRDLLRAIGETKPEQASEPGAVPELRQADQKGLSAPANASTLTEVLLFHAENHTERDHIRFYSEDGDGGSLTYGDLLAEATILATGLQQLGLTAGESVIIMLPTGRDYFISFFGVLLAGGVPVPVYPPGRLKQIEEHLKRHAAIAANCLAPIMVTMPEAIAFSKLMHKKVETLHRIATVKEVMDSGRGRSLHRPGLSGSDPAFIQYTSGSTGMPKGVVLSNANLLANIRAMGQAVEVTSEDVFVSWLPLYHDMGLIGAWLGSLYYACPLIIMSPLTFLARPIRWLRAISQYRGTLSAAPNFAYELCRRRIEGTELEDIDLGSWRCAFNGAEAVSPASIRGFAEHFSACGFKETSMMPVYGLAESSVGLAFPPLNRGPRIDLVDRNGLMKDNIARPVSSGNGEPFSLPGCGLPLPGHQIRVVDDRDRELPDRHEGHIQFKGPSSTRGYFRNPEENRKLFHGDWLDSGDLGYLADGELFITGRSKDLIIKAGRNIYPVELEEAVGTVEGVREGNVAVFGSVEDKSGTEKLVVLAETRKRRPEALEKIRAAINRLVADITGTAPDEVVLAPPNTVLRTSSGKIRRSASRDVYERGRVGKPYRAVWLQLTAFYLTSLGTIIRRGFRGLSVFSYAMYCWLLYCLASPFSILAVALLPTTDLRWQFNRVLVKLVFQLGGIPIKIKGIENIPAGTSPCILASNHASYLDSIILAGVLPRSFGFIAKAELKNNLLLRLLLPRLGTEFVERFDQSKGVKDAQKIANQLEKGRSLVFFPEGTFMRMPGLLPFRLGAFEGASRTNLPVVPMAIRGSRSVLRAGSWLPRRGVIKVIFDKPVYPGKLSDQPEQDLWQTTILLRDRVRERILALCGEPDLAHERSPLLAGSKQAEGSGQQ